MCCAHHTNGRGKIKEISVNLRVFRLGILGEVSRGWGCCSGGEGMDSARPGPRAAPALGKRAPKIVPDDFVEPDRVPFQNL